MAALHGMQVGGICINFIANPTSDIRPGQEFLVAVMVDVMSVTVGLGPNRVMSVREMVGGGGLMIIVDRLEAKEKLLVKPEACSYSAMIACNDAKN